MERISTATKVADLFGAGKHGWRDGDVAGGVVPTYANAAWFNTVQEELANVVELSGTVLTPGNRTQLAQAIQAGKLFTGAAGGTADAITSAFSPAITALKDGMALYVRGALANATNAPTFTPNNGTIAPKVIVKGAGAALVPGDIAGAGHWIEVQYDLTLDKWVLLNPATGVTAGGANYKGIQPITSSVAANALTVGLNPTTLDFRSSALTNGVPNTRSNAVAVSLVVPSGATLGTTSGQLSRLILIAIDNAGSIELAIVNQSGGNNLDETTLISTTAISAAATAPNVVYSTTARVNVPFRVVGYLDITEAAAGTWATDATTKQGMGGQALVGMTSVGYGQKWQDVTASRALGTTYYNLTGRPIMVGITTVNSAGAYGTSLITVNGVNVAQGGMPNGTVVSSSGLTAIVPPGASYTCNGQTAAGWYWSELR